MPQYGYFQGVIPAPEPGSPILVRSVNPACGKPADATKSGDRGS